MGTYVIDSSDRRAFLGCRRAWDYHACTRQGLEPVVRREIDIARVVRDALAVYYFPGMWGWERSVVAPLVHQAVDRAVDGQCQRAGATGPLTPHEQARFDNGRARAHRVLAAYQSWAPSHDAFSALRVESDFDVTVEDPRMPGADLVTGDGDAVHFRDRIELLVMDDQRGQWLVTHHFDEPTPMPEVLHHDEDRLLSCWAWERFSLDVHLRGIIYNCIDLDGKRPFERQWCRPARAELEGAAARLGHTALAMTDPLVDISANPSLANCPSCVFFRPCRLTNEGLDPAALVDSAFQPRPSDLVEGRLGGVTWSMGRGAAPPRFGRQT